MCAFSPPILDPTIAHTALCSLPKKRTRSASSASDGAGAAACVVPEELPPPTKRSTGGKPGNSRNRRGGPRKAIPTHHDAIASVEDEGMCPSQSIEHGPLIDVT